MNKPVLIVAMLAMVLVVSVPALTQTDPTNDIEASPVQEMGAVQYSGDAAVDPSTAPAPAPEPALAPAPEPALAPAPEPAPAPAPEPEPTPEPVFAPAGATVGCGVLYGDPVAICEVDAEGFITLPDGSTAPVLVRPDGTAFVQDASGALTLIGYGASFVTGLEAAGDTAQDTGQGAAPAAEPVAEPEAEPVEPVAEPVIPAA